MARSGEKRAGTAERRGRGPRREGGVRRVMRRHGCQALRYQSLSSSKTPYVLRSFISSPTVPAFKVPLPISFFVHPSALVTPRFTTNLPTSTLSTLCRLRTSEIYEQDRWRLFLVCISYALSVTSAAFKALDNHSVQVFYNRTFCHQYMNVG